MAELRRLVELHYENQSSGDFERDAQVFTPDVVTVMPGAPQMHGLEEVEAMGGVFHRALWSMLLAAFACAR